jgi:hypothetical protein
MYDFIGDVHGHADKLEELLVKLGEWLRDYDPGVDGAEWARP